MSEGVKGLKALKAVKALKSPSGFPPLERPSYRITGQPVTGYRLQVTG